MVLLMGPNVIAELEGFIHRHITHGFLTPAVGRSTPHGYLMKVACPCGVTFGHWVTSEDAALELVLEHLRTGN